MTNAPTYTPRRNLCRGCGRQFHVTRAALDDAKSYLETDATDDEAQNTVEFCRSCAGVAEDDFEETTLYRHVVAVADALGATVEGFERGGDAGDEEADFAALTFADRLFRARHDAVRYLGDGQQLEWCACDHNGDLEESIFIGAPDADAVEAAIRAAV